MPPAPSLVADSLNATMLSLEWSGRGQSNNDTMFGVQWRYEEIPGSRWIFCCNHSMLPGTTRKIENLTPYTKYRVILIGISIYLMHVHNLIDFLLFDKTEN